MIVRREFQRSWFRRRQRHTPTGLDHIELAWEEHDEPTPVANASWQSLFNGSVPTSCADFPPLL